MIIDENTISLPKFEIFFYLCKMKSYSLAAKHLKISQSMVSKTIKKIEKILNVQLIKSSKKPISLTEMGEKFYEICKTFDFEIKNIEENIHSTQNFSQADSFTFTISLPIIISSILYDVLKNIIDFYPEIIMNIRFTNEINISSLNTKDFFLITEPYSSLLLNNEFLGSYDIKFAASKKYIQKKGFPRTFNDLIKHDFLYVTNYPYSKVMPSEHLNKLSDKYLIDNELAALEAMKHGSGIALAPEFISKNFSDIMFFTLEEPLKPINIYLAYSNIKNNFYSQILTDMFRLHIKKELNHDKN